MAKRILVGDIADKGIVSVAPSTSMDNASKLFRDSNVSLVPVIEDGRLVGILSEESLKGNGNGTIRGAMKKPLFLEMDCNLDRAIQYLIRHGLNRVPVVESSIGMKCIGIVTASELLRAKKSMQN